MPKIQSYSAPWLQEPNPGHKLFEQSEESIRRAAYTTSSGPKRTIARRGNEVFVASGREIRWGDITYLKDAYEAHQSDTDTTCNYASSYGFRGEYGYRVCGFTSPGLGVYGASKRVKRV